MMKPDQLVEKMQKLAAPCACGSGKMYGLCCGTKEAGSVGNEMCPCNSGKMVKDCCMKDTENAAKHM